MHNVTLLMTTDQKPQYS